MPGGKETLSTIRGWNLGRRKVYGRNLNSEITLKYDWEFVVIKKEFGVETQTHEFLEYGIIIKNRNSLKRTLKFWSSKNNFSNNSVTVHK